MTHTPARELPVDDLRFDFEAVFDADYLWFYEHLFPPETCAEQAELVAAVLGVEPGDAVLDLACGQGRIAIPLAEAGLHVTGIDNSPLLLEQAREAARAEGVALAPKGPLEFRLGDMRDLADEGRYRGAFNWFTSFGYFDDATDREVLRRVCRALAPGGSFALEHVSRDFILEHFEPVRLTEREDDLMLDRNDFDTRTGRLHTHRTVIRDGNRRDMHMHIRLFTFPEIRDWLLGAGFAEVDAFGDEDTPFELGDQRMLVVARKG